MCVCVQEKFHVYFLHDFDRYRQAVQTFFCTTRVIIYCGREKHKTDRQTHTTTFCLIKKRHETLLSNFHQCLLLWTEKLHFKKRRKMRIKKGLVWRVFYNKYWFHHRNKIDVVNWTGPLAFQPGRNEMSRNKKKKTSENPLKIISPLFSAFHM